MTAGEETEMTEPACALYWGPVPDISDSEDLAAALSPAERAAATGFRLAADRAAYLFSHALLRYGLDRPPGGPGRGGDCFAVSAGGKPIDRTSPPWHFSLSRRRGLAAVAISRDAPIGIDVEPLILDFDPMSVAREFFARQEWQSLAALPDRRRQADAFDSLWTLKEAVVKATGQGLAADLKGFAIALSPPRLLTAGPDGSAARGWRLLSRAVAVHRLAVAQWRDCPGDFVVPERPVSAADLRAALRV